MNHNFTVEQAHAWVNDNRDKLLNHLRNNANLPESVKEPGSPFEDVWLSGAWLNFMLKEMKVPADYSEQVCLAHSQRALEGNPYEWAVSYLNELVAFEGFETNPVEEAVAAQKPAMLN